MSLVQMTLSGGAFILFIVVVRALALHRLPKGAFLALWEMAALRLLLPFTIPLPFSLFAPAKHLPVVGDYLAAGGAAVPEEPPVGIPAGTPASAGTTPGAVLPMVWLAGAALMAAYFTVSYVRAGRRFRASTPDDTPAVRRWLAGRTLHRPLEVRQSALVSSPLTYGVLRPEDMERGDEAALTYILTHEYIHIRRFDSVAKLAFTAVLCVHWFNPLVWVMYVLANRDLKLSCDERVMDTLGGREKVSYALTLINMVETRSRCFSPYNHFSKLAIEERIEAIMKYKKASVLALALAVALVVGATTAFATPAVGSTGQGKEISVRLLEGSTFGEFISIGTDGIEMTSRATEDGGVVFTIPAGGADAGQGENTQIEGMKENIGAKFLNVDTRELENQGDARTSLAPGSEMAIGSVAIGEGQSITVSLAGKSPLEIDVILKSQDAMVDYKKTLTLEEGSNSATVSIPVSTSAKYTFILKNVSQITADFSFSYVIT